MQTYHLRCDVRTECPPIETFEIFKNPQNLARITPKWLNFQVLTRDVEVRQDAEIEYIIRWLGLPMHWKTLITEYQPPYLFVDEQVEGPYALWRHRHSFEATTGGTKIGDDVEYALPLGLLGEIAHRVIVKKQLEAIFKFRQREIAKLLGGNIIELLPPTISREALP